MFLLRHERKSPKLYSFSKFYAYHANAIIFASRLVCTEKMCPWKISIFLFASFCLLPGVGLLTRLSNITQAEIYAMPLVTHETSSNWVIAEFWLLKFVLGSPVLRHRVRVPQLAGFPFYCLHFVGDCAFVFFSIRESNPRAHWKENLTVTHPTTTKAPPPRGSSQSESSPRHSRPIPAQRVSP